MRSQRIHQHRRSFQHFRALAGYVVDMVTHRINAQVKEVRREEVKVDMVRRGSRHRRQQANQDSLEEGRIAKGASMARLRESQAKAKVKDHAGYAMDPICRGIAPKVGGKEADIQARLLHTGRDPG